MKSSLYDNMIRSVFKEEDKDKYSHFILVIDNEDDEYVRFFVKREENIKDVLFNIISIPIYKISEIYNYDMDIEQQIRERRAYHIKAPYNKMEEAKKFATKKHDGQTRKDGTPYIHHPIQVAKLVEKYFKAHPRINELITAAYLHDTIEDTSATIEEIEEKFGSYVSYLVEGVTTNKEVKTQMGKTDYLCYKMLNMDEDVLSLKLCDRLSNVKDLKNAPSDFKDKYTIETLLIMDYLVNNRYIGGIHLEIIKEINQEINNVRKSKILKLTKNITKI